MSTLQTSTSMRAQTYPSHFPDGWYRVAGSHQLRRGGILYRECLGTQLVVYRSDRSDDVHAMDAYCPHMGANLGQGRVVGGHLECPFHRWRFAPDGRVAAIPYAKRLPSKPCQNVWPVREAYGQIFVYYRENSSRRGVADEPPYEFIAIDEIDSGRMIPRGHYDAGRVGMHILEFAENSVDYPHFQTMHGDMFIPWTTIRLPFFEVCHDVDWSVDKHQSHIARVRHQALLRIFGRLFERTRAKATVTFFGPASVVAFHFQVPDVGQILILQTQLPVGPLELQVDFQWFAEPRVPRWLVFYLVGNWVSQWRNDIPIWENKIHLHKPLLVKEDGPVHRLRRWFEQFYPGEGATQP